MKRSVFGEYGKVTVYGLTRTHHRLCLMKLALQKNMQNEIKLLWRKHLMNITKFEPTLANFLPTSSQRAFTIVKKPRATVPLK